MPSYTQEQYNIALREYAKNGLLNSGNAELNKAVVEQVQKEKAGLGRVYKGIAIPSITLSRTASNIVRSGGSLNSSDNPDLYYQVNQARAIDDFLKDRISAEEYQQRTQEIAQQVNEGQQRRTINFAIASRKGLENARKSERQRFADIASTNYPQQEKAQTEQLKKINNTLTNAGFNPADLQQAKGKPNLNKIINVNTAREKQQNEFAKSQAFRSVESVRPNSGVTIYDPLGGVIAKNVKQSGGFNFAPTGKSPTLNQAIISSSGAVLGSITGKSPKTSLSIFETQKTQKEIQGPPRKQNYNYTVNLGGKQNYHYTVDLKEGGKQDEFKGITGGLVNTYGEKPILPLESFFEKLAKDIDVFQTKDKGALSFLLEPVKEGIVTVGSLRNLGLQLTEYATGHESRLGLVKLPKTGLDSVIEGAGKPIAEGTNAEQILDSLITGNKTKFRTAVTTANSSKAYDVLPSLDKSLIAYEKKYGKGGVIGIAPSIVIGLPKRLLPASLEAATIPTAKGTGLLGASLRVGYGKLSAPIVTTVGKKIAIGSGKNLIDVSDAAKIIPEFGAFEIATSKGLTRSLLLSDKGLEALAGAGRIAKSDIEYFKASQELAQIAKLGLKKIPTSEFSVVDEVPRGTYSGLDTILEQETFIKEIDPILRPEKGSQLIPTQLSPDLRPLDFTRSDKDIDYLAGLRGEKHATSEAVKRTEKTIETLNQVMQNRRGAAASGTKVFTGIIEGVVFQTPKKIKPNQYYHGGKLEDLISIQSEGFDLSRAGSNMAKRFRKNPEKIVEDLGIGGVYLTKDPIYATGYAETAVGKTRLNPIVETSELTKAGLGLVEVKKGFSLLGLPITKGTKVLNFNQIEKNVIANLRRQFPEFGDYQKSLIDIAKNRGYGGISKPVRASPVGRFETVIFNPKNVKVKQIFKPGFKLEGKGEKLFELLTSKDQDKSINSALSVADSVYGVSTKSRKVVKIPTGYKTRLGLTAKKKQITAAQQLLNNLASGSRIQYKVTETPYTGSGKIPFLNSEPVYTSDGFRVGSDLHRFKDIVRSQPFAIQTARLLEKQGYAGKIAQVENIFERIKTAKPEINFDARFNPIEETGEYADIESLASFVGKKAYTGFKEAAPSTAKARPNKEQKAPSIGSISVKQPSKSIQSNSLTKMLDSTFNSKINSASYRVSSRVNSQSSRTNNSVLDSLASISSPRPSSVRQSPSIVNSPSIIKSPTKSPTYSPTYSPTKSPTKSPPKSPAKSPLKSIIRPFDLNITKPVTTTRIKPLALLLKFDQFKSYKIPSRAKRKLFVADVADPQRAGVAFSAGLKVLRSSSSKIYKQQDKNLAKARKKKSAYDPLNGLKISKNGKYTYSSKNLLNSYTKIKI